MEVDCPKTLYILLIIAVIAVLGLILKRGIDEIYFRDSTNKPTPASASVRVEPARQGFINSN